MPYKPIEIYILMGFSYNLPDLCIDSLNNKRYFSSYAASYFSNDYDELHKSEKQVQGYDEIIPMRPKILKILIQNIPSHRSIEQEINVLDRLALSMYARWREWQNSYATCVRH